MLLHVAHESHQDRSSEFSDQDAHVRRDGVSPCYPHGKWYVVLIDFAGTYVYEKYVPTGGTDVKARRYINDDRG